MLERADGHAVLANAKAMELMHVTARNARARRRRDHPRRAGQSHRRLRRRCARSHQATAPDAPRPNVAPTQLAFAECLQLGRHGRRRCRHRCSTTSRSLKAARARQAASPSGSTRCSAGWPTRYSISSSPQIGPRQRLPDDPLRETLRRRGARLARRRDARALPGRSRATPA